MLNTAIEIISDIFLKLKNLLSSFEVADGINYWSILIVSFISFGCIRVLANATGSSGIAGIASGAIRAARSSEVRAKNNKTSNSKKGG